MIETSNVNEPKPMNICEIEKNNVKPERIKEVIGIAATQMAEKIP